MNQPTLALVDCNNFFVSCERVFRPDIAHKPVVVLSSNDGCVVARSNEAKTLGIPMGAPIFKYRQLFHDNHVIQFSANFELYGDISQRIVTLLTSITPRIEVYSVDESFLDLSELDIPDYNEWGRQVRALILRNIGIPVSFGIATSKTLAKLAADRVKKLPELKGALDITQSGLERDEHLATTPIQDVWGVGWRLAPRLRAEGVHTALDLAHFPIKLASQLMGVHGRQMITELNGTACVPLERVSKPQQMINRGRQFGEDTNQFHVVESAVASLTARAAAHLRREGQLARSATIVLRTNRHKPGFANHAKTVSFLTPTADTGALSAALINASEQVFSQRCFYHKADVILHDLLPADTVQTDLFGAVNTIGVDKATARLQAIDRLNERFGKGHIIYAAERLSQSWHPRHRLGSPRYTTRWDDLPEVRIV